MRKETVCVDVENDSETGSGIAGAIQPSTAFRYIDGEDQFYPRYFNTPNQDSVVKKLCRLEQAEAGVVFSSGMAAISTTMLALLKSGDEAIFLKGLYGGTHSFVTNELSRNGVSTVFVDGAPESFEAAITPSTRMIYIESPTNPLLDIVDLKTIAKIGRERDVVTVIDNTFASPILQNPIAHGIDVVVHSGTKYLGGHSDLCCGAVLTSAELGKVIQRKALNYGGSLNAQTCYMLDRSLKTLALRVNQQSQNAASLAVFLDDHARVSRVYYPGLADHPGHDIAAGQMSAFGAMIAFELAEQIEVIPFLQSLTIVTPALSLGGVESTVCVPALTSHRGMTQEARTQMGLSDRLIRFSVGVEAVEDIQQDLTQAINAASGQAVGTV